MIISPLLRIEARLLITILLTGLLCSPLLAQERATLAFSETTQLPEQHPLAVQEPMKCGPGGDIYVRFAFAGAEADVTVISPDGKHISWVRARTGPQDLRNARLKDFAPGPNGEVFLLASQYNPGVSADHFVGRFKEDGTYVSISKLDTGFNPNFVAEQIAVFGTGDFLVSGNVSGTSKPLTAIFSGSGQFVRQVTLSGDLDAKDLKHRKNDDQSSASPQQQLAEIVELSSAYSADDGNVYLVRGTASGPVFVISPAGSVKKIPLTAPQKDARLLSAKADRGALVAEYQLPTQSRRDPPHYVFSVLDVVTGKLRREYETKEWTAGVGMACYNDGSIWFLTADPDQHLLLVRASAP